MTKHSYVSWYLSSPDEALADLAPCNTWDPAAEADTFASPSPASSSQLSFYKGRWGDGISKIISIK